MRTQEGQERVYGSSARVYGPLGSGEFFVKPEQSIEVEHREKLCIFQWLSLFILLSLILDFYKIWPGSHIKNYKHTLPVIHKRF